VKKLPHRQELLLPVLAAVADLGGSGAVEEIRDKVIANLQIPDDLAEVPHTGKRGKIDGRTELEYNLAWARTDLRQLGYLTNSSRGVWSLTPRGMDAAREGKINVATPHLGIADPESADWRTTLSQLLIEKLSPAGFERLIQRVLRESGFAQVEITGRSGDGGIDGRGVARINGILSFRIVFQCKRYKGGVSTSEIRDFRGAMQGRADKGLFITTGYFTREAQREATRDGALAVDLVDGEQLVEKLKSLRLGVEIEVVESVKILPDWFDQL